MTCRSRQGGMLVIFGGKGNPSASAGGVPLPPKPPIPSPARFYYTLSPLKKGKREAAAQRRPAQSERKNRVFSAKRQAVWFGTQSVSNWKCSKGRYGK